MGFRRNPQWTLNLAGILAHARKALLTSMGFRKKNLQCALNLAGIFAHARKALLTSMGLRRSIHWALMRLLHGWIASRVVVARLRTRNLIGRLIELRFLNDQAVDGALWW